MYKISLGVLDGSCSTCLCATEFKLKSLLPRSLSVVIKIGISLVIARLYALRNILSEFIM